MKFNVRLDEATNAKLHALSVRKRKNAVIREAIQTFKDAAIHAAEPARSTSFILDDADVALLGEIAERNGLSSRTQVLAALIDLAYNEHMSAKTKAAT